MPVAKHLYISSPYYAALYCLNPMKTEGIFDSNLIPPGCTAWEIGELFKAQCADPDSRFQGHMFIVSMSANDSQRLRNDPNRDEICHLFLDKVLTRLKDSGCDFSDTQWFSVMHDHNRIRKDGTLTSDKNFLHWHIVANKWDAYGHRVNDKFIGKKLTEAVREVSREMGFETTVSWKDQREKVTNTPVESDGTRRFTYARHDYTVSPDWIVRDHYTRQGTDRKGHPFDHTTTYDFRDVRKAMEKAGFRRRQLDRINWYAMLRMRKKHPLFIAGDLAMAIVPWQARAAVKSIVGVVMLEVAAANLVFCIAKEVLLQASIGGINDSYGRPYSEGWKRIDLNEPLKGEAMHDSANNMEQSQQISIQPVKHDTEELFSFDGITDEEWIDGVDSETFNELAALLEDDILAHTSPSEPVQPERVNRAERVRISHEQKAKDILEAYLQSTPVPTISGLDQYLMQHGDGLHRYKHSLQKPSAKEGRYDTWLKIPDSVMSKLKDNESLTPEQRHSIEILDSNKEYVEQLLQYGVDPYELPTDKLESLFEKHSFIQAVTTKGLPVEVWLMRSEFEDSGFKIGCRKDYKRLSSHESEREL